MNELFFLIFRHNQVWKENHSLNGKDFFNIYMPIESVQMCMSGKITILNLKFFITKL